MTTAEETKTVAPDPDGRPSGKPRRHGLLLASVVAGTVLAVLVLVVHHVPELVARYAIQRELRGMEIVTEGVGSLHIDLWRRQAVLGRVKFGAGRQDLGQIGYAAVRFRLLNLFRRQAVIEELIIDGIDVQVTRETNGDIIVNGIELAKLMAADEDAEPAPAEDSGWGAGLNNFELRNSRLFFTDRARGTLALEVERLNLAGFRTWEPDNPGTFDLTAKLNEIPLRLRGEARPFADLLTVAVDIEIKEVDFAKIEAYTGPLGLERQAGVLNAEFTHNVTLHPNGRIEVGSDGNIEIRDGDKLYPDLMSVRYDNGNIGLSTSFVLDEAGNTELAGSLSLDLEDWDVETAEAKLGAAAAGFEIPDFSLTRTAEGSLDLSAKSRLAVDQPRFAGPIEGSGSRIVLDLSELKVAQADGSLSVTAAGTAALQGAKATVPSPAGEDVPGSASLDIALSNGSLGVSRLLFTSADDTIRIEAQPRLVVDALGFAGAAKGSVQSVDMDLAALTVERAGSALSLSAAGTTALDAFSVALADVRPENGPSAAEPLRLDFSRAKLDLAGARLAVNEGAMRLEARPKLSVTAPKLDGPTRIAAETLTVDLSELKVEQMGRDLSVAAAGMTALGASTVSMAEPDASDGDRSDPPLALAFSQAMLDLKRMLLALNEGGLRLDAQSRLAVDALDLAGPAQATLERLEADLDTLDLTVRGDEISVAAGGKADLASLHATIAGETPLFPVKVDLGRLTVDVKEGGWEAAGPEPRWQARLDGKLEGFGAVLADGGLGEAKLRTLFLEGGYADQAMNVAAETLSIGGLDVAFTEKLLAAPAGGTDKDTKAADQTPGTPPPAAVVKVDKLAFSDPARIRFSDTSVTPGVAVDIDVAKLDIAGLDTGDPSRKTDLVLAATVNKLTKVEFSGWTQAVTSPTPSFDLAGVVDDAQLAPFSPYAAKAIGLNLESGTLDVEAKAKAASGALDGGIKLNALDLGFSALSAEDAERLSARVGLPIETAVGLLQDSDGRIKLSLPVSGTVAAPSVDLSQAIAKAVGGAIKSIFPPTALASLISSGLDGAGKAGLQFAPIPFAPGEAELGPEGREVADNVAKLLKQRPKLRLQVCGRATAADFEVYLAAAVGKRTAPSPAPAAAPPTAQPAAPAAPLDMERLLEQARSDLTELATRRGRDVRQYIVGEHRIEARSLGECRSIFDNTDNGPPRAEVRL